MNTVVKVQDLVQKIGRKTVLNGLTFEVSEGECFGVFGAGGSGKTILLHILAGIDRFRSGTVEVLDCNVRKSESFKKRLGLVTQERSLFQDLNVAENLDFIATLKNAGRKDIQPLIERFDLECSLTEPVNMLETGMYQRLSLACALLNTPAILIVDDLPGNVDPYSCKIILRELVNFLSGGGTCIWGFSNIELCKQMDRVGWLEDGRMTIYGPQETYELWEEQASLHSNRAVD